MKEQDADPYLPNTEVLIHKLNVLEHGWAEKILGPLGMRI